MDISENIDRKMEMTDPDGVSDEETEKLPEIQVGFIDISGHAPYFKWFKVSNFTILLV